MENEGCGELNYSSLNGFSSELWKSFEIRFDSDVAMGGEKMRELALTNVCS